MTCTIFLANYTHQNIKHYERERAYQQKLKLKTFELNNFGEKAQINKNRAIIRIQLCNNKAKSNLHKVFYILFNVQLIDFNNVF